MNFEITPELIQQMGLLATAEQRLAEIKEEDNKILEAYKATGTADSYFVTQDADEDPEAKERQFKKSSDLYRLIFWLAHQPYVQLPPSIKGMATVGEDKWTQAQAFRAWMHIRMNKGLVDYLDKTDEYLMARGINWRRIPAPKLEKIVTGTKGRTVIKEILLDPKSLGFIVHFRYLPKEEHDKVRVRVGSIAGRQFHDGSKAGSRMPGEPHWYIPGDSISAKGLLEYLLDSEKKLAELSDTRDYERSAYWARRFEQVKWDIKPGVVERAEFLIERSKKMLAMSEAHKPSEDFNLHFQYQNLRGDKPRPFQIAGVEYILECSRESRMSRGLHGTGVYVGDPMGLGKTLECGIMSVIEGWEEEIERSDGVLERKDLRCLILCPAQLKNNWVREFYLWLSETASNLDFQVQKIKGGRAVSIWGNFVVINPELLKKEFNKETGEWEPMAMYTMILSQRWFAVVADEAHYYKSWGAQRTANTLELFSGKKYNTRSRGFEHFRLPIPLRIMASGSPVLNRPAEWPSQLEALGILEPLGGQHRYIANYCQQRTPPERLKELSIKLKERGYLRREKTDMVEDPAGKVVPVANVPKNVLDPVWVPYEQWPEILAGHGYRFLPGVLGQLPPKIRTVVPLPLSQWWRIEIMRAERDFINWLAEHYKEYDDANRRIAAAMRAQALVYIQKIKHLVAQAKVRSAVKWIENFMADTEDEKLVYYVWHRDIHQKFLDAFPDAAYLIGGQNADERTQMVDQFQTDPRCRLIVCTMGSGGVGITLTAANHMAIMELPWGPAVLDQLEDRIWGRLNDLHGASIYYHIAEYTIDGRIIAMIDKKRTVVTAVTTGADVEQEALIRELLDDYHHMYGKTDPSSFEELLKAASESDEEKDDDDNGSGNQ